MVKVGALCGEHFDGLDAVLLARQPNRVVAITRQGVEIPALCNDFAQRIDVRLGRRSKKRREAIGVDRVHAFRSKAMRRQPLRQLRGNAVTPSQRRRDVGVLN